MSSIPQRVEALAEALRLLPQIGPRQALRTAIFLVRNPKVADSLLSTLQALGRETLTCEHCFRISEENPCAICTNAKRDDSLLLVVEEDTDVEQFEQTGAYNGRYFVLGGRFSSNRGTPSDQGLRTRQLLQRAEADKERITEIILAISPTMDGQALTDMLMQQLKTTGITTTRLARGIPTGGEVEYADEETLRESLQHRA